MMGASNAVIDFTGTNIIFPQGEQNVADQMGGGRLIVNVTDTDRSKIRFSAAQATITLKDQGVRGAAIGCGLVGLAVKTTQTWLSDSNAYVRFFHYMGSGTSAPPMIESLDGGRLDNLGQLNLHVTRGDTTHSTKATAMRLGGGTYGSLRCDGYTTSFRTFNIVQQGDVILQGRSFAGVPATNINYSFVLSTGSGASTYSAMAYYTDGYAFTLSNGLYLTDNANAGINNNPSMLLSAIGSVITVGGDILIHSVNWGPWAVTNGNAVSRSTGIQGDAGTVLNLAGSYSNSCRSLTGNGLSKSVVNLIGGTGVKSFEVGDAVTNTTYRTNNCFAIANLNVGNGTATGNVQLVNNFLNENPTDLDKTGEMLMVSNLNINVASTLDVNGQGVHVQTALTIASDGWLDLRTGQSLVQGNIVSNFYGVGNQLTAWDSCRGRVKDSTSLSRQFSPTYIAGDNKTYWQVAEPTAMVIMIQ